MASSSPAILRMPDYMCYLCRREIDPLPTPSRIITFSPLLTTVQISPPCHRLPPRSTNPPTVTFSIPLSPGSGPDSITLSAPVYANKTWTFRVHASCWDIVSFRCRDDPALVANVATTWCHALSGLNWNFMSFESRQGRYDLPRLLLGKEREGGWRRGYQKRVGVERAGGWEGFWKELEGNDTVNDFKGSGVENRERKDVFGEWPESAILRLVRWLDTKDVLRLREASRGVARVTGVGDLDEGFWESRFWTEREMGFTRPRGQPEGEGDWRGLYFRVRRALKRYEESGEGDVGAWLAKRRYWWDRLVNVVELHEVWGGVRLAGEEFVWMEVRGLENRKWVLKERGCVSARLSRDDGDERDCETVCLPLPKLEGAASAIGVTVIEIAGQVYISGVRVSSGPTAKGGCLGYVRAESETLVDLHHDEKLFSFRVRADDDAVRAVKIITQSPDGRLRVSPWIGDMAGSKVKSPSSAEPVQEMPLSGTFGAGYALAASFDSFRMIALGLGEII